MVWYLAAIQHPDGHWSPGMLRPPLGGAEIVATVLAMRSLQLYPLEGQEQQTAARVARAREWLRGAKPEDEGESPVRRSCRDIFVEGVANLRGHVYSGNCLLFECKNCGRIITDTELNPTLATQFILE